MVRDNDQDPAPDVCLDRRNRLAREYQRENADEQVTMPDMSPSLTAIVMTGNVGSMPGNNNRYVYPDMPDDDNEAHEMPDFQALQSIDPVEKENLVNEFINDDNNYVKEEKTASPTDSTSDASTDQTTTPKPSGKSDKPV